MKMTWYGTASLMLESGGTRLLFDPYLKRNPKLPPLPIDEANTADAVFITHPHFDHFIDIDSFSQGKPVYVSENGIAIAAREGCKTEMMVPMSANEKFEIGPFTVITYQSRHCVFDVLTVLGVALSPRTYFRYFVPGVKRIRDTFRYVIGDDIYAFEVSDGEKRIMILGSAGLEERVEYPKGCDLLVFPFQGRAFMHKYMRRFLEVFEPKGVAIDHFDDAFPPYTHRMRVKKFASTVEECLPGARAIIPTEGEWFEV